MSGQAGRPEKDEIEEESAGEEDAQSDVEEQSDTDQSQSETVAADEIAELQAKVEENWDKFLRTAAEL